MLVIIGLIVGGILFGKELIRAAELRALMSQIDQFKIAANQFKEKFGDLPGDISSAKASKFGFFSFTGTALNPEDFENGKIDSTAETYCFIECGAFWRHLVDAGLISGNYGRDATKPLEANLNNFPAGIPTGETGATPLSNALYTPAAKAGFGFIGVGSVTESVFAYQLDIHHTRNLFYLQSLSRAARFSFNEPMMSAADSYSLDLKLDDGDPNDGKFIVSTYDAWALGYRYWSATVNASSNVCTFGDSSAIDLVEYNANRNTGGDKPTCIPLFIW